MKSTLLIFCGLLVIVQGRMIDKNSVYKPRVVNGKNAKLGERPYQIAVLLNGRMLCGGSILNELWVVTAAHCVYGHLVFSLQISAGTINLREPYSLHQAQQIITHEDYISGGPNPNDIALIKVATPFEFSYRIQPAQLPESHAHLMTKSLAIVSGWGQTDQNSAPNVLQKATVYITDPEFCQAIMELQNFNIFPTQICANDPYTIRGECNGDSGGPLTVNDVLIGIVSWSVKEPSCGSARYPGVHTRVSEYIDWIHRYIR